MGQMFLDILLLALQLYSAYFIAIALFGIIKRKRRKVKPPKNKFAVVIAARNEEAVIGKLIDSLQAQAYPSALYDIYVAPNNCIDNTASVSAARGAKIIQCIQPVYSKGDALNQAFAYLMREGAAVAYDAFVVFDADNVVDKNFLMEMNNAFCTGAKVVKGKSVAKNPYDSWVSGCYAIYYAFTDIFYNEPRANIDLSAKLVGTGFAVAASVLQKSGGWHTQSLTEDVEFSAMMAIEDEKIAWAEKAITYDEQPNNFATSLRQRRRWVSGILQVCTLKMPELMCAIKTGKPWRRLDVMLLIIGPIVSVLALIPVGAAFFTALLSGQIMAYGLTLLHSGIVAYFGATALAAFVVLLSKRWDKRIIKSVLTYPVFLASWLPLKIVCVFKRTKRWEPISHTRVVPLEEVSLKEEEYDIAS